MVRLTTRSLSLVNVPPVGVYSSGPIWGRIVDARGPRIAMAGAFFLLLIGYGGMKHMYDTGDGASTVTFVLLLMFGYMTGSGGNAGLSGAVNATAKSFPEALVSVLSRRLELRDSIHHSGHPPRPWCSLVLVYRLSSSRLYLGFYSQATPRPSCWYSV